MVNLKLGGSIRSHTLLSSGAGTRSPLFVQKPLYQWWDYYNLLTARFCMVTGAQFMSYGDATQLSFPLRETGDLVTAGGETRRFDRSVLFLDGQRAWITDYSLSESATFAEVNAALSGGRTAIVARDRYLNSDNADEQTYAAIRDGDGDGASETVIFYVSRSISWNELNDVLGAEFGIRNSSTAAIQLDGGESAQIRCRNGPDFRNRNAVGNSRNLPHVLLILHRP
jgi:hypothetical protein